jgi:hypothetical protein
MFYCIFNHPLLVVFSLIEKAYYTTLGKNFKWEPDSSGCVYFAQIIVVVILYTGCPR